MESKVKVESVVRATIECDMSDREKTLNFLYNDNWKVIQQGPKRISLTEINPNIFYVVAEIRTSKEDL